MKTKKIRSIKLITYIVKNKVIDIPVGSIFNLEDIAGIDYFVKSDNSDIILDYRTVMKNSDYFEDYDSFSKYDDIFEYINECHPEMNWDDFVKVITERYRTISAKKKMNNLTKERIIDLSNVSIIPEFDGGRLYQYTLKTRE